MKIIDPGHVYELALLDDWNEQEPPALLTFVKRDGHGYPGNSGRHAGTNIQEVLRVLIDRVQYLNNQIPDKANDTVIHKLRECLLELELRAAERHRRVLPDLSYEIEKEPVCRTCGHVACTKH